MSRTNITKIEKSTLVDLKCVNVDVKLPVAERVQQYFQQIKNPYAFRVGEVAIKIEYCENGVSLNDALVNYLLLLKEKNETTVEKAKTLS